MKQLTNLALFSLLLEPIEEEVYQEKLENAYEEFINQILHLYQKENDIVFIIRKLNFARIELISSQVYKIHGNKKKCGKNIL